MININKILYIIFFGLLLFFILFYLYSLVVDRPNLHSDRNPDPGEATLTKTQIILKIINNYCIQHLFTTSWYFEFLFSTIFSLAIIYTLYETTSQDFMFYVFILSLLIFGINARLNLFNNYHMGVNYHIVKILHYSGKLI